MLHATKQHYISVNKPAKEFLKRKFDHWYSKKVIEQIQEKDIDAIELQPVHFSWPVMRELGG